jgi:hypothetical protein
MSHQTKAALQSSPIIRHRLPKPDLHDSAPFNTWFDQKFPKAVEQFGSGFLEGRYEDVDGYTHYLPAALNDDAWAAALGEKIRMIYFPPEATFYFFDERVAEGGAFCATSQDKVQLLLSNQLMRCAEACPPLVDIENFVVKFRKPESLRSVVDKAKVILATTDSFFSGEKGERRIVRSKVVEPSTEPAHVQFVKKAIIRQPEAKLTLSDAFSRYYQFCENSGEQPLTRAEFKALMVEAIREAFSLGLRHDVRDSSGKANHGWVGIDCCLRRN